MAGAEERALRLLVVGGGPAGRRHLRHALALGHDAALLRRAAAAPEAGITTFTSLDDAAAWRPAGVVVATPPSEHLSVARWAVARGCDVLVEKPLAAAADGVDAVVAEADAAGVHLAVAYNLRFHPALQTIERAVRGGEVGRLLAARLEVGSYLPSWHPELDHRTSSAAMASLGGGALLTLAHELDLALWIGGPASLAAGVAARVADVVDDVEDVAELVLRHDSGVLSSVHVDLVDRVYNRRSRWVGDAGTIEWSFGGPVVCAGAAGSRVLWDDPDFDLDRTYGDELAAFARREAPPGDALADARRALKLIDAVPRP